MEGRTSRLNATHVAIGRVSLGTDCMQLDHVISSHGKNVCDSECLRPNCTANNTGGEGGLFSFSLSHRKDKLYHHLTATHANVTFTSNEIGGGGGWAGVSVGGAKTTSSLFSGPRWINWGGGVCMMARWILTL